MRLIDADALNIRKYTRWFENVEDARQVERMIREAPTIAPPPNAPLTLEELREMDGEEIYTTKEGWIRCWGIGDGCFGPRIETGEGRGLSLLGYGDTWLAYRREPEEA